MSRTTGFSDRRGVTGVTIVVIAAASLVVVAMGALVVPRMLPASAEERYDEDRTRLHKTVLLHVTGYSPVRNTTYSGDGYGKSIDSKKDMFPTKAMLKAGDAAALMEEQAGSEEIATLLKPQSHPGGSKAQSGTPFWEDVDGDGKRSPAGEKLFYHGASPEPSADHWNTTAVTFEGVAYVVDSRDWFMDIDDLVRRKYLEEIPESASPDNSVQGAGSYSWYVDENGDVKSMLYSYPRQETDGFQGVYP